MSEPNDDDFLILEEGENTKISEKIQEEVIIKEVSKEPKKNKKVELIESEKIDAALSSSLGGVWKAGWEVYGIDCPDCAIKITNSLNNLKGVSNTDVSVTSGLITFEINLEENHISTVNNILRDLGYAPNSKWWEIKGVNANKVQARLGIDEKKMIKRINIQPGVLESRVENNLISVRLATNIEKELTKEFEKAMLVITGEDFTLKAGMGDWGLRPDQKQLLGGLIGFILLPIVYFGVEFNSDIGIFLALPATIFCSMQLFKEAFQGLKRKQLNFQTLITMAILGCFLLEAWFEALLISVLIALATNLETSAIRKAREAMQGGLNRLPNEARLIKSVKNKIKGPLKIKSLSIKLNENVGPKNVEKSNLVPIGLLNIGDRVEVRSGEIIPIDGIVCSGEGLVDKSALTGESLPIQLSKGDFIEAGLILTRGPLIIETIATGNDTRLSELINKTKQYQNEPTRLHTVLELFTVIWVPLVLFGSIFVALILPDSYLSQPGLEGRLRIILLLWVTACPCALLLCAPIPHAISLSLASNKGVIAKGGDVLEKIAKVNLALLDKTGTLTQGKPKIIEIVSVKNSKLNSIIGIAAGLELSSNHPYASAVIEKSQENHVQPYKIQDLKDEGSGIIGKYRNETVAIGNKKWIEEKNISIPTEISNKLEKMKGKGISILAKGDKAIAAFGFASDVLNSNSSTLINNLRAEKIKVELLSGDNQESVNNTANELGIPLNICRGGLTPEQKVEWVKQRSNTHITLMAGDGFNDAAAMAVADVGISVGNKEQLNLDSADVMIPKERPDLISSLCILSKKTRNVIIQNLILSITLTTLLVFSVIFAGNDKLWLNVLAHELSAIMVILNAMKLGIYPIIDDHESESKNRYFNPFSIIFNLFKELYHESKEVIQTISK